MKAPVLSVVPVPASSVGVACAQAAHGKDEIYPLLGELKGGTQRKLPCSIQKACNAQVNFVQSIWNMPKMGSLYRRPTPGAPTPDPAGRWSLVADRWLLVVGEGHAESEMAQRDGDRRHYRGVRCMSRTVHGTLQSNFTSNSPPIVAVI